MPNMIWLYRRPILDYWAEHEETLGAIVSHVLVHEIGHHFGLSDDDMEAIEAACVGGYAPMATASASSAISFSDDCRSSGPICSPVTSESVMAQTVRARAPWRAASV